MYSNQRGDNHASAAYLQQEITSEDALTRVARIYEMAGLEIARARVCLASGDVAAKGRGVHRASRCISALQSSLNMEHGGAVAQNLDRLYTYLLRRVSEAHASNSDEIFGEISGHLSELGQAWRQAANQQNTASVGQSAVRESAVEAVMAR